jgi:hypothetical protein
MIQLTGRFCVVLFVAALSLSFCTRAEEGEKGNHPNRPRFDAQDWARRMLSKADEVGFTPDQKSKIEAIANAKPEDLKQLGGKVEDIYKNITPQQREKLRAVMKHNRDGGEHHDGEHKDGERREGGNRDDNDDHK